ncbi:MAG: family 20 glycosylhydrolase [Lewinella sp.]|nr:family 20 glycosylhydrolase [Lewinella sp.]
MDFIKILAQITFCLVILSCNPKKREIARLSDHPLIPEPAEMSMGTGVFEFDAATRFVTTGPDQQAFFASLAGKFAQATGFEPEIVDTAPESNFVLLKTDAQLGEEAYRLKITTDFVEVSASERSGFLHGLETLRQLLPPEIESTQLRSEIKWAIPALDINDYPRYPWRGLMLDVSRHFFEKDYLLHTLDRMALFKLNTLHLHLVDDQGWRIEIKQYPKLTEVGGFRVDQEQKHWDARTKNQAGDKATYGGFYTQEEIKEIVAYARDRRITVVPEIEMPAHVMSALAAYPEYSCFGEPIAVPSGGVWPITDIYCPGKEATFTFLEDVLMEVMELFPSRYIHIGGDEATRTNWEKCPHCQKRMREEGLKTTAELQSYFIKRMERFISSKGRILLGWDEILEGGLAPGATVMSWRGFQGGWEASEQGHDVVMTPGDYVYLNQYQGDPDHEPIAFGGYVPLSKVYSFDPVVDSMSSDQKKHILGAQANLWSEFVTNEQESEYMLYPRLAALAEVLWTPEAKKSWPGFSAKIPSLFKRFDLMGLTYSRSAYAVTAQSRLNEDQTISVSLQNEFPDSEIRYVLNDQKLDASAPIYSGPIMLNGTTTIRAAVYQDGKMVGAALEKTFNFHKAVGKPVTYQPMYHEQYPGTGADNMVNVLRGSKNFHDGQWQAWLADEAEITIDLQEATEISSVGVGSMENQGSGIYFPIGIEVYVSDDGDNFTRAGAIANRFENYGFVRLKDFWVEFDPQEVRWIRVKLTNLGSPPQGGGAWMFFDEIVVE